IRIVPGREPADEGRDDFAIPHPRHDSEHGRAGEDRRPDDTAMHCLLLVAEQVRRPSRTAFLENGWRIVVVMTSESGLWAPQIGPKPCSVIVDSQLPRGRFVAVLEHAAGLGYRSGRAATLREYGPGCLLPGSIGAGGYLGPALPGPVRVGRIEEDE